jgi:hypothetical protein
MEATMKLGLVLASLLVSTAAYAQAPGDYGDEGTGAPGMVAPVAAPVVVVPPPPVRRWSIGLGFGSMGLHPHDAPDGTQDTQFGIGQLAVRYLAGRHLEIELTLGGGREKLEDGSQGDREVNEGVLAARYRFSPGQRWNWWLMFGMGSLGVTRHDATKDEKDAASQSTMQFGVGLERRWTRFALQLELRAVGVKANDTATMPVKGTVTDAGGTTTMPIPPPEPDTTTSLGNGNGMAGGQMVLSGNYYF